MDSKTLIGGTAYKITGGRACVGGTAYSITGGKSLIGGTAYSIAFKKNTLEDLLSRMSVVNIIGKNDGSSGVVRIPIPADGTYYAFAFNNGRIGIHKVVVSSGSASISWVKYYATSSCGLYVSGSYLQMRSSSNSTTMFGGTLALVQFNDYTNAEAEALLSATTLTICGNRDSKSIATVSATTNRLNGKTVAVATMSHIGFSYIADGSTTPQVIFGTNTANPSLLRYYSSAWYLSVNGTNNTQVNGASILTLD